LKKSARGPLIYIIGIAVIIFLILMISQGTGEDEREIDYDSFMREVEAGNITHIEMIDKKLYAVKAGTEIDIEKFPKEFDYYLYVPDFEQFNADMESRTGGTDTAGYGIQIKYSPSPPPSFLSQAWPVLLSVGLLALVFIYIMRQQQGGGNKAMSFGKSRARMQMGSKNKKTFADVAGADEEKEELAEVVDFLKSPKRFIDLGARIPKGVLLVGPPGGGKTLLAKAVAGEAGVPFFSISGSDFVEMFVGVGASRVRDMFENAKKNSPCIIFIDEIDAVGRQRGSGMGGGHDEREQTLNQLLVEMDGFQVNEGIIILAATNRKDILDPALLRPGRFDRQIYISFPDVKGREEILKVHSKGKPFADDVKLDVLAKRTPGFIGADLENVLNEAAILTARAKKPKISMVEIEEAITRVIAGPQKKSRVITDKDKRCTAYHEVGHAICAKVLPDCDAVHEVSIIPRGMAAGYTLTLPDEDDMHVFRSKLLSDISMMLGGRAAEAQVLDDISTGAISDLQRATETARNMVVKYGMSEEIGLMFLGGSQELFLGKEIGHTKDYSDELAFKIDEEVRRILDEAYKKAQKILKDNEKLLHSITAVLIERERIDGDEFEKLFNGEELPPLVVAEPEKPEEKKQSEDEKPEKKRKTIAPEGKIVDEETPIGG
jgi:cell division protease FtsH